MLTENKDRKCSRLSEAEAMWSCLQDVVMRGRRQHPMFSKVSKAGGVKAVVLPCNAAAPLQVMALLILCSVGLAMPASHYTILYYTILY